MKRISTDKVLLLLADYLETNAEANRLTDSGADKSGNMIFETVSSLWAQLEYQDPAHLLTLAQAQADQQARLRALVEGWRERSERHHDAGIAGCADELEAVLNNP